MSTPRLWSWKLSPFAGKARVALAVRQIGVELVEVDPADRPARLRDLNPTNRVPVLEVGGVAIRESTAIAEWAQETGSGPSLWPQDPAQRAAARGLLSWVDNELTVPLFSSFRKAAFGLDKTDPPDIVDILRERFKRRWPVLEDLLARTGGPWLMGGQEPTLADLAALPLAVRLPQWAGDLGLAPEAGAHPLSAAWVEALRGRPEAVEVDRKGG